MVAEARFLTPDGGIRAWYSAPPSMHGVRLEFVDAGRRSAIEQWIQGATYPDG
jgi:hypothetical protein